eukprot:scaffold616_cov120-Isochrysis_galbana.AAC.6
MPRHVVSRTRARASPPTRRTPQRLGHTGYSSFSRRGRGTAEGEEEQSGGEACAAFSTVRALQTRPPPAPHG